MASEKEYLTFVLESVSLKDLTYKPMMGEYLLYYNGKVIGGIYDDRLLIKVTPSVLGIIKNPTLEVPYKGGKQMLKIEDFENADFLQSLIKMVYNDVK